jgi:hypothetical protein
VARRLARGAWHDRSVLHSRLSPSRTVH